MNPEAIAKQLAGKRPTVEQRFWSGISIDANGCWRWNKSKDRYGYGCFVAHGEKRVHRFAYKYFVGEIPEGLMIDHLCRVRDCANPAHMELVSNRTNVIRGNAPTAINAKKTHCVNGHAFDEKNTAITDSKRRCRKCGVARLTHYRRRDAAAIRGAKP